MELRGHIVSRKQIGLVLGFCLLNIADTIITLRVVANGYEGNLFMRMLLEQPAWVFSTVKIGLGFVVALVLLRMIEKHPDSVSRILKVLVCAMVGVCLFNLISL